jgi:hypothetical protein
MQPNVVQILPVNARTAIRVFDADQGRLRVSRSQRARDTDAGLRICSAVKTANINFHNFPCPLFLLLNQICFDLPKNLIFFA